MFFALLIGAALVAVGIGALGGGGWATAGAVVLLIIGGKLLFMALMFAFFGRRFRAMRRAGRDPEVDAHFGPWPCGRRGDRRARLEEWRRMTNAGAESDGGSPGDVATAE